MLLELSLHSYLDEHFLIYALEAMPRLLDWMCRCYLQCDLLALGVCIKLPVDPSPGTELFHSPSCDPVGQD